MRHNTSMCKEYSLLFSHTFGILEFKWEPGIILIFDVSFWCAFWISSCTIHSNVLLQQTAKSYIPQTPLKRDFGYKLVSTKLEALSWTFRRWAWGGGRSSFCFGFAVANMVMEILGLIYCGRIWRPPLASCEWGGSQEADPKSQPRWCVSANIVLVAASCFPIYLAKRTSFLRASLVHLWRQSFSKAGPPSQTYTTSKDFSSTRSLH